MQLLLPHPNGKPHQGSSAKGRRRGKHDHGNEGASILGRIRHIWTHIREFNPKETRSCGADHTSTHQTERFPLESRHIIPGECPRWCWDGGCLPGWNTYYLLSHRWDTRAQQWHPSHRCRPSLGRGQQGSGGGLQVTKSPIDAHQQKLVWELGMALHQNYSKTEESIKEAKAIFAHSTQEAKILCSTTIKEVKAICACSTKEAKTLCSIAIREAEAQGASQADSLQWLHAKFIQCLEEPSIEEESKGQLYFLSACQAALWASPLELHGVLVASYHILLGHVVRSHPFSLSQGVSAAMAPSPPAPEHSPRPKWQHPSPDPVDVLPPGGTTSKATLEGPPSSKQWEAMPLHKALTQSCQEAFGWDSSLAKKTRRNTLGPTAQTLIIRTPATSQMSFNTWLRPMVYWTPPSMRLKKHGQGGTSCSKLIMH